AQAADGWRIRDRVSVINMMAVGCRQRSPDHLVHPDQELDRGLRAEQLLDEPVNFGITESVNVLQTHLLLVEPLSEQTRGIRVIEDVPPRLQLHLKLGNRQGPGTQRLHQASLEIEKSPKPTRVLGHSVFAA